MKKGVFQVKIPFCHFYWNYKYDGLGRNFENLTILFEDVIISIEEGVSTFYGKS